MSRESPTPASTLMRMLGLMLILVGVVLISIALIPSEGGEGIIIFFPFVLRVSGSLAILLSALFFLAFLASMILLPWYLISRSGMEEMTEMWMPLRRHRRETTEYIITLKVPSKLRNTLYVEVNEEEIYLKSTRDSTFQRKYTLPTGFDVEDVEFDYEESYLILKLLLRRKPPT